MRRNGAGMADPTRHHYSLTMPFHYGQTVLISPNAVKYHSSFLHAVKNQSLRANNVMPFLSSFINYSIFLHGSNLTCVILLIQLAEI